MRLSKSLRQSFLSSHKNEIRLIQFFFYQPMTHRKDDNNNSSWDKGVGEKVL